MSFLACGAACRFSRSKPPSTSSAGRSDEVLVHESEDAFTDLLEFSFHFRDVFLRVRRLLPVVLLSLLCAICSSLSATSAAD